MKEIRFRAWNKKFIQHDILLHGPYAYLGAHDFQKGKVFRGPLMQFTGLHDKSGKEIYEGDIVDWGGDKHTVIFQDGTFGYLLIDHKAKTEEFFCMPQAKANHVAIIGNIYGNPELLRERLS